MLELTPDEESECEACDLEKMKCEGDGSVGVRRNYWRMNETANIFIECTSL